MAETHFFMEHDDAVEFCRWLIESYACTFVMDDTEKSQPPEIKELGKLRKLLTAEEYGPRLFVKSPKWTGYPLLSQRIKKADGSLETYICQRYGGPAFDLVFSNILRREKKIVVGSISDYPYYYIKLGSSETFVRPEAMKAARKEIINYFRKNGCKTIRQDTQKEVSYWALAKAREAFYEGWSLIQGDWNFRPKK